MGLRRGVPDQQVRGRRTGAADLRRRETDPDPEGRRSIPDESLASLPQTLPHAHFQTSSGPYMMGVMKTRFAWLGVAALVGTFATSTAWAGDPLKPYVVLVL